MRLRLLVLRFLVLALPLLGGPAFATDHLWQKLREGGAVVLIRHARAPGTGDPAGFRLDDCATQRNLSEEGRAQARAMGEAFRREQIRIDRVLSSQWCRALETARLAFGTVQAESALNSFFAGQGDGPAQTANLRRLVTGWSSPGVLVLVTHQVNITALTDIFPREGEVIVLQPKGGGDFNVVGRFSP